MYSVVGTFFSRWWQGQGGFRDWMSLLAHELALIKQGGKKGLKSGLIPLQVLLPLKHNNDMSNTKNC